MSKNTIAIGNRTPVEVRLILENASDVIASLIERVRAVEQDAARYAWLRKQHETLDDELHAIGDSSQEWFVQHGYYPVPSDPGALDAAIDDAMRREA